MLFPLSLSDISLWIAVIAMTLLATSEVLFLTTEKPASSWRKND